MAKKSRPVSGKIAGKHILSVKGSIVLKKSEKSRFIADSFVKAAFNFANIGIVLLDSKRKVIRANVYFQNLIKYTEKELKKIAVKEITHPDDYVNDDLLFNEVAAGKRTDYTVDKRYIAKDGSIVFARLKVTYSGEKENKKKVILAIIEDITREKYLENRLETEKNYLNLLLENMPDIIYFKDKESRFLKVSNSLADKHKCAVEDMYGKTDFDFFSFPHSQEAFNDENKILLTGIPVIDKEEKETWPNGRVTWVSTTKMPMYNDKKEIIGTFGISKNITERKKNELTHDALLKISEAVFTASDMQSMFVTIHEVLGTLMPVKNLYIALYDEKSDLITFPYFVDEYDPPRETSKPRKGLTEYILRTGKALLVDEKTDYALRAAGEVEAIGTPSQIWLGVPLKISDKTIGVIVVQDYDNPLAYQEPEMHLFSFIAEQIALVIERKRSAVEIARYTEELKQLNATKDKFFSIIAHDLKNPFVTILGLTELLISDYYSYSDEEKLSYLKELKKTSENSHSLLQNLLQWSRSQTGFIEFHPQPLFLSVLVNQNIELFKSMANKKEITLKDNVSQEIKVFADADMLNTIIRNLLSNAIKFSYRKGEINIKAEKRDGMIFISIEDNGQGMSQDTLRKLFRIDVAHSSEGTENETGSGLGLMLCMEFIKKNKGDIKVISKLGKGSTFTFSIPRADN